MSSVLEAWAGKGAGHGGCRGDLGARYEGKFVGHQGRCAGEVEAHRMQILESWEEEWWYLEWLGY